MASAIDMMVLHAQQYRVNPPVSAGADSGEVQRAEQNLHAAELRSQAAAQITKSAENEVGQARRNLQAAQSEEQRATQRVSAAQADYQRSRQPGPVQVTGVEVNIFV